MVIQMRMTVATRAGRVVALLGWLGCAVWLAALLGWLRCLAGCAAWLAACLLRLISFIFGQLRVEFVTRGCSLCALMLMSYFACLVSQTGFEGDPCTCHLCKVLYVLIGVRFVTKRHEFGK